MHDTSYAVVVAEEPPPFPGHVSGKRWGVLEYAGCLLVLAALIWTTALVCMCLLLRWADTPDVHLHCAGFWDFMLVSVLTPVLIPGAYLMLTTCLCLVMSWQTFSGACMLVFAVSALVMTLNAAASHACVEALRAAGGPLPWLILVGWLKAGAYAAWAWSNLMGGRA